ncbi:MAG: MFS transporter [Thermomicrobiales bacterium]
MSGGVAETAEPGSVALSTSSGQPPVNRGALYALQSRPFLLFWSTIILSLTGVWVRITAQGWLVYDLTSNEFLLGLVSFCQAAPVLIAAPIAGAILDRVNRRVVLLVVQVIVASAMLVLATLVATGRVQVWQIMVIAVIVGTASGFDWPARLSLLPSLVNREQLQSAVALNASAFNTARVVGPAVSGLLIAAVGVAACFYLNAAMYVPFILVLATLSIDTAIPMPELRGNAVEGLLEGYRYIWRTPKIRGLLSVDIIPLMFGISYFTLAPAIARDVLGLSSSGLGVLLAANGIGHLIGTVVVASQGSRRGRGRIVVTGVAAFAILVILFALSTNPVLSGALILCIGFVSSLYGTMNDTLLQTNVDEAYRGRVMAVYSMFWGLTPIGSLEAGLLANFVGVQKALALNGLIILVYAPLLWKFSPVRRIP